jgi:hypothetical protein
MIPHFLLLKMLISLVVINSVYDYNGLSMIFQSLVSCRRCSCWEARYPPTMTNTLQSTISRFHIFLDKAAVQLKYVPEKNIVE